MGLKCSMQCPIPPPYKPEPRTSKRLSDALMPHAHAEEGELWPQLPHDLQRYA